MGHIFVAEEMIVMYNKNIKSICYIIIHIHISEEKCLQIIKMAQPLARKMFFQVCAKIIEELKEIINSADFLSQHRFSEEDFSRDRKLPFQRLIYYLINLNKRSYQDELDSFFKLINGHEIDEREVTKGAVCTARKKLKYEAFVDLNRHLNAMFYTYFNSRTWFGFNLLAFDGSTVRLPKSPEITDHFGVWKTKTGESCPVARVSQMFDVVNKVSVDALISPKSTGERDLAIEHLKITVKGDLVLLDRGYPAFWLFKKILSRQADFCARISNTKWKQVNKFFQSGKKEEIVFINPSYSAVKRCRELGLDTTPIPLRLVRIELENGETEILITSLTDPDLFPHSRFSALYHLRWPVEEDYKTMKCRIEVENFSGKSILSVNQDFHAKIFSKNLTAVLSIPAKEVIRQESQNKQYEYQLNFTQALSRMKDTIVLLFTKAKSAVKDIIVKLHNIFVKTIEPIRPGRKYPRKSKVQRKGFYMCYKPIR